MSAHLSSCWPFSAHVSSAELFSACLSFRYALQLVVKTIPRLPNHFAKFWGAGSVCECHFAGMTPKDLPIPTLKNNPKPK